uniref:Uncharacterized protein n=1 Tax=Cacopsylla melanoneura TaxID=428564 RepID=A0A8D8QMG8_9HEMI
MLSLLSIKIEYILRSMCTCTLVQKLDESFRMNNSVVHYFMQMKGIVPSQCYSRMFVYQRSHSFCFIKGHFFCFCLFIYSPYNSFSMPSLLSVVISIFPPVPLSYFH